MVASARLQMAPPAPLARSLGLGADPPGRAPPAGSRRPAAEPGAGQRSPPPLWALPTPSAEACRRRSLREARPRWRAALLPAGECAVRAWDAAGQCGGTCGSSDADADPCDAQVKFAERVRGFSPSGLLLLLQRLGSPAKAWIWGKGLGKFLS